MVQAPVVVRVCTCRLVQLTLAPFYCQTPILVSGAPFTIHAISRVLVVRGVSGRWIRGTWKEEEAIRLVADRLVGLAIAECEHDGLGLARFIESAPRPRVPIVLVSKLIPTEDDWKQRREAAEQRCAAYVLRHEIHWDLPGAVRGVLQSLRDGVYA